MIKLRISYNTDEELAGVIRLLSPVIKSYKVAKNQKGQHKKAYVDLKPFNQESMQNTANY